ncbi:MAG: signal peptidase I [Desulfobacteraceae bacterium]|nr:MAG: signal peptidase I [Desulfobacteraceae bacterium]
MSKAKKTASKTDTPGKKKNPWRENIEAIIIAIVIALFIRTFIVQAFKIPSGSMKDTLLIGDQILVNKFIYGVKIPFTNGKNLVSIKDPERGDIVVFKYPQDPSKDFIKRVVGVAGDKIKIVDKQLYLNGKPVEDEPFAVFKNPETLPGNFSHRDNLKEMTVPENSLFVMGDNRDRSHDSRFWGFVDLKMLKGEAFMIYWSWDRTKTSFKRFKSGIRWGRIGNLLL